MSDQIPGQNNQPEQPTAQPQTPAQPPAAPQEPIAQPQQHMPPQQPFPPQMPQQQPAPAQDPYAAYQPTPPQSTKEQLTSTVTLNYWLSVFFAWLPALIFYFTEKGKSPLSDQYHRENLNFSILRTIAVLASSFIIWIPILGQIIWFVAWAGGFVLHLLVALKAKERFEAGEAPGFLFNLPMIK